MSSTLRLSIIMVLLLATAALGLMAYNMNLPKPVAQLTENTPAPAPLTVGYFVAARPLPGGTLARDEDFAVRSAPSDSVPTGAIRDTPDAKIGLRGSMIRKFLDAGSPVTIQDVLRPRDRGFLASVLAPGMRAISIKVDAESGVSGLIWPGDYVDVVLTQVIEQPDKAEHSNSAQNSGAANAPAVRALSETILHNVPIIAIDQEIVQGGPANNVTAGKVVQTVSLQLAPEQVKKITVAKRLGTLSLAVRAAVTPHDTADIGPMSAVRAAVTPHDTADIGPMSSCDVSSEIARQNAIARQRTTVVVYAGDKSKEYSVKKHDSGDTSAIVNCDGSPVAARQGATVAGYAGDKGQEYSVRSEKR
jgi:pilus assembly protein CpaB